MLDLSGSNYSSTDESTDGNMGKTGRNDQETYEFVAFLLWYLFLVLCCIVPTCCAYRRRRMVESRLVQHQFDLQRLQQQQLNGQPNFLLLDQISSSTSQARRNNEQYRRMRKDKIGEILQATTLVSFLLKPVLYTKPTLRTNRLWMQVLKDQNFEKQTNENGSAEVNFATDDDFEDFDETTTGVRLPADLPNGNRNVPGLCAICLCPYSSGEKISWSPEICQHAFHKDCIMQWLAKKEELKCPVCRQDYCQPVHVDETFLASEDLFLDSFALALNYARSHASRSWAGEVSRSSRTGSLATGVEPQVRVHVMGGNNDLSLRDQSERNSQDNQMGLAAHVTTIGQLPEAAIVGTGNGGEADMAQVTHRGQSEGISQDIEMGLVIHSTAELEQLPEATVGTNNDGEVDIEHPAVSATENSGAVEQFPEATVEADHGGEE